VSIPVVFDTMVLLQSAARPSRTHATFQAIKDRRVTLALSLELLAEVKDVLSRATVRAKFPALTQQVADVFVRDLIARGRIIEPVANRFTWLSHPDDDHLFNLAIATDAEYLVTWEGRLLNLPGGPDTGAWSHFKRLAPKLHIVTPGQFAGIIYPK
jgi:putative PIN family toxin of toxin-antitoxin system